MKFLTLPKRARKAATKNHVDEHGRRLPGYYRALRLAEQRRVTRNRIEIPDWPAPRVFIPTRRKSRGYDYAVTRSAAKPVLSVEVLEARQAQSERDKAACARSKRSLAMRRAAQRRVA